MSKDSKHDARMRWWREARFGMMIHWGLYSIPAGEWKGQRMTEIAEWIMSRYKIPIAEYEQLAKRFNPVEFDAEQWVRLAKRAGMKYLLFTSKHHDGFAMYRSANDPYNIFDATPFKRDPVAELAAACQRHGLKLCLYYSQALDWHEKDAGGTEPGRALNCGGMSWGNDWDFPNHAEKDFARFFEKKVKPQVREILTQYGPVGMIWFDCPETITKPQCQELYDLVRGLQDGCIINSRLGQGLGDYKSLGDNQVPEARLVGDWETIATMNDTWGYKHFDHAWKSPADILGILSRLASRGVNYALNVGPMATGAFPQESVKTLEEIGAWMDINSEAIYATESTPFAHDFSWGTATTKPGKIYLHIHHWPADGKVAINGLRNAVKKAYLLQDRGKALDVTQNGASVSVALPEKFRNEILPVVALEFDGAAEVAEDLLQQPDGTIRLPAGRAALHKGYGQSTLGFHTTGPLFWYDTRDWVSWHFTVLEPGTRTVKITTSGLWKSLWEGGHKVRVEVAGQVLRRVIEKDEESREPEARYHGKAITICGEVRFEKPGVYELKLFAEEIIQPVHTGLSVVEVVIE